MDSALRRLLLEVLNDNVVSQQFNELLIETGISLESPEWDVTNHMLEMADEILLAVGGRSTLPN